MGLSVCHGVEAVLKQANAKQFERPQHNKTEAAKKKRVQWKSQHRGKEQDARKKWGKSQKVSHSYGVEDTEEPFGESLAKRDPMSTPKRSSHKKPCK